MEGLLAIIILTVINVLELILMLRTFVIPVELGILALLLITVLLVSMTINKKKFWRIIIFLAIINILNILYLYTKFGCILTLQISAVLIVILFMLYFFKKQHIPAPTYARSYEKEIEDILDAIPEMKVEEPEIIETGKVKQVTKTYTPGKYLASNQGTVYHSPKCYWAKKIPVKNRVWFNTPQQAHNKGYKKHSCLK